MGSMNDVLTQYNVIGTSFSGISVKPLRPKYVFDAVAKAKEWNLNSNPNRGDGITFPILGALSSNTAALSATVTTITAGQKNSYTRRSINLELYGDHMPVDTLQLKAETFVDDISDYAFSMTDQAMNSLNKLARSKMDLNKYSNEASGTLSSTYHAYGSYGFGASTAGPLKAKTVRAVVAKLRGANVQPFADGLFYWVLPSAQYTQLRADSGTGSWTSSKQYVDAGVSEIMNGDAGVFEGVRFIINDEVKGAGTNTLSSYCFGQEFLGKAIGYDVRVKTKSTLDGPHENILTFFWDALVGYKTIRRDAGVVVQTVSTVQ
jgi:N4-gp56 family major capsid protein